MWGYYDGFSAAQIELMACDQPITVYDNKKKKRADGFFKANGADVERSANRWIEKYGCGNSGAISLDIGGLNTGVGDLK